MCICIHIHNHIYREIYIYIETDLSFYSVLLLYFLIYVNPNKLYESALHVDLRPTPQACKYARVRLRNATTWKKRPPRFRWIIIYENGVPSHPLAIK